MAISTVGELKKALENFNDDMPLDLYMDCYDRENYMCMKRDRYLLGEKPMKINVYSDAGFLRITNECTKDVELGY